MNLNDIIHEEYMDLKNIVVWHGSTKQFNNFDMNMVGTGDNNSLGGWGIYFSDNRAVSMRYYLPSGQIKQYKLQSGEYFNLDNNIDPDETGRMLKILSRMTTVNPKDLQEFEETYVNGDNYSTTNKNVYDWLTYVLKSDKNASLFLEKMGFLGNTMEDRWERNARNYIVFDLEAILGEVEGEEDPEYNYEIDNEDY